MLQPSFRPGLMSIKFSQKQQRTLALHVLLLYLLAVANCASGSSNRNLLGQDQLVERIIGGVVAKEGEFPFMCSIRVQFIQVHSCGAVLIDPSWLLTAAHCVDGSTDAYRADPMVYCGGLSVHGDDAEKIQVIKTVIHPQWNGNPASGADLALLQLETPSTKAPALLPEPGMELSLSQRLTVIGWGRLHANGRYSEQLRKADQLPYTPLSQCEQAFRQVTEPEAGFHLKSTLVCAGDGTQDTCRGDSGSPLLIQNTVVGIASFGAIECGTPGVPAVYTGVAPFTEWIRKRGDNFGEDSTKEKAGENKKDKAQGMDISGNGQAHVIFKSSGNYSENQKSQFNSSSEKDEEREQVEVLSELVETGPRFQEKGDKTNDMIEIGAENLISQRRNNTKGIGKKVKEKAVDDAKRGKKIKSKRMKRRAMGKEKKKRRRGRKNDKSLAKKKGKRIKKKKKGKSIS